MMAIRPHECQPGCYHGDQSVSEAVSPWPMDYAPECNCGNRHKIMSHRHGSDRDASLPPCPYGEWLKEKGL